MFNVSKMNSKSINLLFILNSDDRIRFRPFSAKDVGFLDSHGPTTCTFSFRIKPFALGASIAERPFSLLDRSLTIADSKAFFLIMAAFVPSLSAQPRKRNICSTNRARASAKVTYSSRTALMTYSKSWSFFNGASTASSSTSVRGNYDSSCRQIYKMDTRSFTYLFDITFVELQRVAFAVRAQERVSLPNIAARISKEELLYELLHLVNDVFMVG